MEVFQSYKPAMAMVGLQFSYAGPALFTRAALLQGLNPRVFVVYRQGIATLIMAPLAELSRRRNSGTSSLELKGFGWIFAASLLGVTCNQNAYFEGLYLASSTAASALTNLVPAITFVVAATLGPGDENWLLGCLLLFASSCFWSLWMIFQVPISTSCGDHVYSSAWMCFFATIQSTFFALLSENNFAAWNLNTYIEMGSCLYAGVGLAVSFFLQAWCISRRGPVFAAMFNPLCTVNVAIFAALFLHEETYSGSLIGALAVIIGLSVVLWGKAKDLEEYKTEKQLKFPNDEQRTFQVLIDECLDKKSSEFDLEEPLLSHSLSDVNKN